MNKKFVAGLLFFLSTQAFSSPISFIFSGATTAISNNQSGDITYFDVNSPVVLGGKTLFDGTPELLGRVSFDSELLNVHSYDSPLDIEDLIKSISFNIITEGQIYRGQGSMAAPVWTNTGDVIGFHLESFGSDAAGRMNFSLNLLTLTGSLDFGDLSFMSDGTLTARIDHAFEIAPVPLPASLPLLLSALLGAPLLKRVSRRRS